MQFMLEIFGQSHGVCNFAAIAIDFSSPKVYEGRWFLVNLLISVQWSITEGGKEDSRQKGISCTHL